MSGVGLHIKHGSSPVRDIVVLPRICIHTQSWPMTGLKPDGGPECTGLFRSCVAFDVDNWPEVSFQCQHPPCVVPHRFCSISRRPASRDSPVPRYFNYSWLGLKFQLVYRADLRKSRKSHGTRYTLQPPSRHDYAFRCVPVVSRRRPLRCIRRHFK